MALCLASFCAVIYAPGRFENTSGDNISARYWPVSVLKYETWTLGPFKEDLRGVAYAAIRRSDGAWLPRMSWGPLPMMLPVYAAADAYHVFGDDWTHDRISRIARLTGITWAVASVVVLYCFLLKISSPGAALASSLLFATGTWNWSLGAQGPSLQAAAVLLHVLNVRLLWNFCGSASAKALRRSAFLLGCLHACIWSVRPQDIFLFAPIGLLLLERRRALLPHLLPFGAGVLGVAGLYNNVYGTWLGHYGIVNAVDNYRWNPFPAAASLLFSPNRGAVVFFPLLLLLPYLWYRLMPTSSVVAAAKRAFTGTFDPTTTPMQRFSLVLALGASAYFLSLTVFNDWHGGWSYGGRYLYDLQPYVWVPITLALAEVAKLLSGQKSLLARPALVAVLLLGLQGVVIHGLGHRNYDIYIWNFSHQPLDDRVCWATDDWIIADTWRAGSNRDRWPDALQRLRDYGF